LDADALFGFGELDEDVVAFDFQDLAGAEGFVVDGLARLEDWLRLGRDFWCVRGRLEDRCRYGFLSLSRFTAVTILRFAVAAIQWFQGDF